LVNYCDVTDEDIGNWWGGPYSQRSPWVIGNTVFLPGHYSDHDTDNSVRGTKGRVTGRANIQGLQTRVVFPIMNSRNEIGNEGKPPPRGNKIDGIYNEYAEVNNSAVPNNSIRRHTKTEQNYLYKGLWVCVMGLLVETKLHSVERETLAMKVMRNGT
jgi:hypothetical protein